MCPLVNKYIISLKLNKYNSLKLHKYAGAGCKIMPWVQIYFVECEYMYFLIKRQTIVNFEWSRKQIYIMIY